MSSILTALALVAGLAFPQDKPAPPTPKEEAELTIEEALKMLKEVGTLMETAEELLNSASHGKALETEKELMERIEKLVEEIRD
jgi:hypothetical protein